MKKRFLKTILLLAAFCALVSCNEPVFYAISQEVKPGSPLIVGAPTNFVYFNGAMYVASGKRLFMYGKVDGDVEWSRHPQPGGRIMCLAAAENFLYALCYESGTRSELKRYEDSSSSWQTLDAGEYNMLQFIYSAENILFIGAGAENSNSYAVLYLDPVDKQIKPVKTADDKILNRQISGAAFNGTDRLFCTREGGVYTFNDGTATLIPNSDKDFLGMINLENSANTIALITRDGKLHTYNGTSLEQTDKSFGRYATGALAIWKEKNNPEPRLLLAGRQDSLTYTTNSGYTYGYLELELNAAGIKGANFSEPGNLKSSGNSITSIDITDNNERYKTTIGKCPVNFLFQAPPELDEKITLFASTQKNGVWSYRERKDGFQWNAEQEKE